MSSHHEYFFKRLYEDEGPDSPKSRLRNNPFNVISLPLCVHEERHDTYDWPRFPKETVINEFLEQANVLTRLGDAAILLARLTQSPDELQISGDSHIERLNMGHERVAGLGKRVLQMNLLPAEAVSNPFDYTHLRAPQDIRELALGFVQSVVRPELIDIAA